MIVPFTPRVPLITVEFVVIGWNVVILFESEREFLDSFGTIGRAVDYARETARLNGLRFVPGAARAHFRECRS